MDKIKDSIRPIVLYFVQCIVYKPTYTRHKLCRSGLLTEIPMPSAKCIVFLFTYVSNHWIGAF